MHTFLTGVRGVIAPLLAFYAVNHLTLGALAAISTGLILAATALLIPEMKSGRGARPASPLVEEVPD